MRFVRVACITTAILLIFGCGGGGGGGGQKPPPPVLRVVIAPTAPSTKAGGTSVQLSATVQNDTSNKGITWTFAAGSAGGTFNLTTGVYTPPIDLKTTPTADTVTATSNADASKSATVTIAVSPNGGNGNIGIQ